MGPPNQTAPSTTNGNDVSNKSVVSSCTGATVSLENNEKWSTADFRSLDWQTADNSARARGLVLLIENGETMSLDSIVNNNNCQSDNTSTQTGMEHKSERPLSVTSLNFHQNTHPTLYLDTLINFLKGNIGCGLLAMGDAFKNGGLLFSPICILVISLISAYNEHLLVIGWYGVQLDSFLSISIMIVPVLITSLIKNLKFIARLSALANICLLVSLAMILFYCSVDLPRISSRTAIGDWSRLPLFFGTTIFAFEGICLILPLEQKMQNPKQFTNTFGVLNVGIVIVTVLLSMIGFVGYLKFGEDVQASLTLNLPEEFLPSKIVIICMMLSILCSYTLQFYVAVEVLWPIVENMIGPFKSPLQWEKRLRVLMVFVTFVGADIVPHLNLFISMVGAVCTTSLGLIFPPLCHMALGSSGDHRSADHGRYKWRLAMDVLTLIMGAIGLTTGVYVSLYETYLIMFPAEDTVVGAIANFTAVSDAL